MKIQNEAKKKAQKQAVVFLSTRLFLGLVAYLVLVQELFDADLPTA
jgi:hypothetical protein